MAKEKVVRRKIVAPAWDDISVTRRGSDLWVEAAGGGFEPLSSWMAAHFDVSDFLAEFENTPRRTRATSQRLPHVRFMNSTGEADLIQFVREYGPVLAGRVKAKQGPGFTRFVQNIAVLRAQQQMFAATASLVSIVNDLNGFSRSIAMDATEPDYERPPVKPRISPTYGIRLAKIGPALERMQSTVKAAVRESRRTQQEDEFQPAIQGLQKLAPSFDDVANLSTAHQLLCRIFNLFVPKLYYADGVVQECPENAETGIRPQLYYLLREVYLATHRIKRCRRDDCEKFFIPDRSNAEYCSGNCANLVRQRRFSARNGSRTNVSTGAN
jgi:hypothetical protein